MVNTAAGALQLYYTIYDSTNNLADVISYTKFEMKWAITYFSLTLATTMICTILIICRIFLISRINHGSIQLYRGVIEILVESALLYSITLLILTGLVASNSFGASYVCIITAITRVSIYYI